MSPRPLLRRLATVCALILAGATAQAETISVFAAASLRDALRDVAEAYEAATGDSVIVTYAGSSVLTRQIALGAPADVFLSANPAWMDSLEEAGLLTPDSRVDLFGNRLVLVAHGEAEPIDITDLPVALGEGRLAMAMVDAVPAGIYGKAALDSLGLWETLAPSVAQTDNVRAALAFVSLGEAPFGIVYATDAMAEPNVSVVYEFPADTHPTIRIPAAAIADRNGAEFLAFLQTPAAGALFTSHGFTLLEQAR